MRQGSVEISLISSASGERFPERLVNDRPFFVAVPNSEYQIRVAMYDQSYLHPVEDYLKLILRVDGQSVGYSGYLDPDDLFRDYCEYTFTGFLRSSVESVSRFHAFKFQELTAANSSEPTTNLKVGVIDVWLYVCRRCNRSIRQWSFQTPEAEVGGVSTNQLPRWQRPSVSTSVGSELGPYESQSLLLDDVKCQLLHHFEVRYQTAGALNRMIKKRTHSKPKMSHHSGVEYLKSMASSAITVKPVVRGVSLIHSEGARIHKRKLTEVEDDTDSEEVEKKTIRV